MTTEDKIVFVLRAVLGLLMVFVLVITLAIMFLVVWPVVIFAIAVTFPLHLVLYAGGRKGFARRIGNGRYDYIVDREAFEYR